jgi:hypothetical protein
MDAFWSNLGRWLLGLIWAIIGGGVPALKEVET